MQQLLLIIHVLVSVALVVLVLLQHGRGADMGATFGSGASNTMFGSQGSLPFMVKLTGGLAVIFFITCLSLSYLVTEQIKHPDTYDLSDSPDLPNVPVKQSGSKG